VITSGDDRPAILLIDDEPTIRRMVSRLLDRAGYQVRAAASAGEALKLVRAERFDAVICDLHLSGLSGVELCEQIWLLAPELAGRIIVSSGDLSGEGVDHLVERAGVPPIPKPFTGADLLRAVAAICPPLPSPHRIEARRQAS
jgi:two-component system sensor histidine kinase RpfC